MLRIGLVGPDQTQPCGIADYTARLATSLQHKCTLVFVPFRDALADAGPERKGLADCQAILVHYERSLLPEPDFLRQLSRKFRGNVFVVPHEVYTDDPFAYPYSALRTAFPPLLWLKRLRYLWTHQEYAREKTLQRKGYFAAGVIPLSGPSADILRPLAGSKILHPVPHAYFIPPDPASGGLAPTRETYFPQGARKVLGIFGFLNPGLDYDLVFDLLKGLDQDVCLLIMGGARVGGADSIDPESTAVAQGLSGRVRVTGYLPEADLSSYLGLCDLFLSPMRFKSNSGSLLNLIHLGKPILASDLPLTRYLKKEGAPLALYTDGSDLAAKVKGALDGSLRAQPNRYPWRFDAVAEAYVRVLEAAIRS